MIPLWVAVNALDILTTFVVLGLGGAEMNPIQSLIGWPGFTALKVVAVAFVIWLHLNFKINGDKDANKIIVWPTVMIWSCVVWNTAMIAVKTA